MTQENAGADAVLGAAAGLAGGAIGAAVGLLGQATAFLGSLSGPSTQKFEVNKDNVLQAGKIIQDQAAVLRRKLDRSYRDLRIPLDARGADPVSADIVNAWNDRLVDNQDSYAERVNAYISALDGLATQLKASAQQYGFTEEEVTTAFGSKA